MGNKGEKGVPKASKNKSSTVKSEPQGVPTVKRLVLESRYTSLLFNLLNHLNYLGDLDH